MDGVIQIGFLVLAVDRLLAIASIVAFVVATPLLANVLGLRPPRMVVALLVGAFASRAAYVVEHLDTFLDHPASLLQPWPGGFTVWPGAVAAAIVIAWDSRPTRRVLPLAAVPLVIALLWVGAHRVLAAPPRPLPPDLVVSTMDGRPVHLRDMKGRAFVLNLWATWCPPCRREMPMMVDVASTTPVPVLFVNQGESAGRIEDFLEGRNFKGVRMLRDPDGLVARAIGSPALPTTLFIDAGGKVRSRYLGELSRAALTAAIDDLEKHPT